MRKETDNIAVADQSTAAITSAHLLHPARHFAHPRDILAAEHIARDHKRAILASWASDIFAIESMPGFRRVPGADHIVSYDDIIAALKSLDDSQDMISLHSTAAGKLHRHGSRLRHFANRFVSNGLRKGGRRRQLSEV
ncbi:MULTISPECIES: hypothetical protein [unclassified Rhizobium]|uniref:hypothetical protein n=1 Tax=unclassified Rhizobium TaxID=2613769 RepID=UPI000DE09C79|nr:MULTISPECIES: hypothetical protein [unclassified Rhizobium]MBB3290876.1 hypothetical protein [Rhizobium sp. BK252]MBB3405656.1 hypothetical protein [Rhizobium sp. BK289]MBB3418203.1 hypothetical protein [Rhizobium sp. BK284]MBB3486115.1 hypothetical protein [Rhizobium sp. BK347]